VAVRLSNILKSPVLKELITIPDFDIGKTLRVIVLQREKEQALIVGEVISPTVIPPVTVAEQDDLTRVVEGNLFGHLEHFRQTLGC